MINSDVKSCNDLLLTCDIEYGTSWGRYSSSFSLMMLLQTSSGL